MKRQLTQAAAAALLICATSAAHAETFTLQATPQTVEWGHYDTNATPALRIKSGDTVVIHTLITSTPPALEKAGVPADQVQELAQGHCRSGEGQGPRRPHPDWTRLCRGG